MDNRDHAIAIGLMQMALTFLGKSGDFATAALLQQAIDTNARLRPLEPGETIDPEMACLIAGISLND